MGKLTPTADTTASCPLRAAVKESTDSKSTTMTFTDSGKVALEPSRMRTVTKKSPESTIAFKIGPPILPPAPVIATFLIDMLRLNWN